MKLTIWHSRQQMSSADAASESGPDVKDVVFTAGGDSKPLYAVFTTYITPWRQSRQLSPHYSIAICQAAGKGEYRGYQFTAFVPTVKSAKDVIDYMVKNKATLENAVEVYHRYSDKKSLSKDRVERWCLLSAATPATCENCHQLGALFGSRAELMTAAPYLPQGRYQFGRVRYDVALDDVVDVYSDPQMGSAWDHLEIR